jgi:hypothetical protein
MTNIDYLTDDNILPENQKFVCLSFLSKPKEEESVEKNTSCPNSLFGIKIRGVFSTYELACEHAKKLQTVDPYFNVFVGDMGKWLPYDPSPDSIKESEYANTELNSMMKSYIENQEKAKLYHEHRKNELVRKNILDNLNLKRDNLKDLKKEIKNKKTHEEKNILESNIKSAEEQIQLMDTKKKELDKQIDSLDEQLKLYKQTNISLPKIIETETNNILQTDTI